MSKKQASAAASGSEGTPPSIVSVRSDFVVGAQSICVAPLIPAARIKVIVIAVGGGADSHGEYRAFLEQLRAHSILLSNDLSENASMPPLCPPAVSPKDGQQARPSNRRIFVEFMSEAFRDFEDFDEFQLFRRVFAVIGVVVSGSGATEEHRAEFQRQLAQFPHAVANTLITPALIVDVGEFVTELVGTVVSCFGSVKQQLYRHKHHSPCGLDDVVPKEMQAKLQHRMHSRADKLAADLLILAGLYPEAVSVLASVIEENRAVGDAAWQTAAQEAFHLAMALQSESLFIFPQANASSTHASCVDIWSMLPQKLATVASSYEKCNLPVLAFDLLRTCSLILHSLGRSSEALIFSNKSWHCCTTLHPEKKILVLASLISDLQECARLPARRLAFWHVKLAATLRHLRKPELAMCVLEEAFVPFADGSGPLQLQAALLREMLLLSELHAGAQLRAHRLRVDRRQFIKYSLLYLTRARPLLSPTQQGRLYEGLRRWTQLSTVPVVDGHWHGLPIFRSMHLLPLKDRLVPKAETGPAKPGPFIYDPRHRQKLHDGAVLVAGETAVVEVVLCNPLDIPLDLVLTVRTEGCACSVETIRATLPKQCAAFSQHIYLMPEDPGTLRISHLEARLLGVIPMWSEARRVLEVLPRQPLLMPPPVAEWFLLEGESQQMELLFGFGNDVRVADCQVALRSDTALLPEEILFADASLCAAVAVGGDALTVTLRVRNCVASMNGAWRVVLTYAADNATHDRVIAFPLAVHVSCPCVFSDALVLHDREYTFLVRSLLPDKSFAVVLGEDTLLTVPASCAQFQRVFVQVKPIEDLQAATEAACASITESMVSALLPHRRLPSRLDLVHTRYLMALGLQWRVDGRAGSLQLWKGAVAAAPVALPSCSVSVDTGHIQIRSDSPCRVDLLFLRRLEDGSFEEDHHETVCVGESAARPIGDSSLFVAWRTTFDRFPWLPRWSQGQPRAIGE